MNYRTLLLSVALLASLSATAQTTPAAPASADTLASSAAPSQVTAAAQLPWWLPTAAQCADIRALEAAEAPAQAARREKRMQRQSKKLSKQYPQATE